MCIVLNLKSIVYLNMKKYILKEQLLISSERAPIFVGQSNRNTFKLFLIEFFF